MSSAKERSLRVPIIVVAIILVVLLALRLSAPYWEQVELDKPAPRAEFLVAPGAEEPYSYTGGEDIIFHVSEEQLIAHLNQRLELEGLPQLEHSSRYTEEEPVEGEPVFIYSRYSIAGEKALWLELIQGQTGIYSVNLDLGNLSESDAQRVRLAAVDFFCPGKAQEVLEQGYSSDGTNNFVYCGGTTVVFYHFDVITVRPASPWEWEHYGVTRRQEEEYIFFHLGRSVTADLSQLRQDPDSLVEALNQRLREGLPIFDKLAQMEDPDDAALVHHFYMVAEAEGLVITTGPGDGISGIYFYSDAFAAAGLDGDRYAMVLLEEIFPQHTGIVWELCTRDTGGNNTVLVDGFSVMALPGQGLVLTPGDWWKPPQRSMA